MSALTEPELRKAMEALAAELRGQADRFDSFKESCAAKHAEILRGIAEKIAGALRPEVRYRIIIHAREQVFPDLSEDAAKKLHGKLSDLGVKAALTAMP